MSNDAALATLVAKDEIRDLVLLYSRGVDRKDMGLLRSLYARGATDDHGKHYNGSAEGYLAFLEKSLPHLPYSGHHVCNHYISVNGDEAEGEVYALAVHLIPDGNGGLVEDRQYIRYVDRYRKEDDCWRFAARIVCFDLVYRKPANVPDPGMRDPLQDPSVTALTSRAFARGERE